jgi:hypothetical protein
MKQISILFFALAIASSSFAQTVKYQQFQNAGASDTTSTSGRMWYSTIAHKFSFVENGVIKHFGTGSTLPPLSPGYIYVGNGSSVATPVPLSGDASLSSAGSLTVTGLQTKSLPSLTPGFLKYSGSAWTFDASTYITGNQTITLSGDVSGSGTTAITTAIGAGKVTNAMLAGSISDANILSSSNWNTAYNRSGTSLGFSASTFTFTKQDASTLTVSVPTFNQNTTGTAAAWTTGRTLSISGDLAFTSPSFDGTGNVTAAGTLATVNSNVGTFGSATKSVTTTVNGKGLITAISEQTLTPAVGSITGLGTNVATFLATPSSANEAAALTDETGTGADVFAGSPAFTGTPTLGTLGFSDTDILFSLQKSVNSFVQFDLQNTNAGAAASIDLILNNDIATATTHYGDFGMNSSGFTGSGSLNLANAVYLYASDDDLVFGTKANKAIHFLTNNSTTDALAIAGNSTFNFTTPSWTATANNQYSWVSTATGISRSTASDAFGIYDFNSTITANSTSIDAVGFTIDYTPKTTSGIATVQNGNGNVNNGISLAGMTPGTYTSVAASSTSGTGTGALFTIVVATATSLTSITKTTAGSGYNQGETLNFNGSLFGGSGTISVTILTTVNTFGANASALRIYHRLPDNPGMGKKYIDFQNAAGTQTLGGISVSYLSASPSTYGIAIQDQTGTFISSSGSSIALLRNTSTSFGSSFTVNNATFTVTGGNSVFGGGASFAGSINLAKGYGSFSSTGNTQFAFETNPTVTTVGVINTVTVSGSATNGTYNNISLTGGTGTGALYIITVAGGVVTAAVPSTSAGRGLNYTTGDVLSGVVTGGTASITVASVDFTNNFISQYYDVSSFTDAKSQNNYVSANYTPTYNITSTQPGTIAAVWYKANHTATGSFNVRNFIYENTGSFGGIGSASANLIATWDVNGSSAEGVSTSSAGTLTLDKTATVWVFTGTTTTWTLPAISGNTRLRYVVYNRGSGNLTLQRAGSDNLYAAGASVTSVTIAAGSSNAIINDGSFWLIR